MENLKEMNWKDFMDLEEVQIDESLSGNGNALFYNDGNIQVSVDINPDLNHDDTTLWEDKTLAKELQELVIEEQEVEYNL